MKYKHTPLESARLEIRLLTLEPGQRVAAIRAKIDICSLHHPVPYEALSYCWGEEDETNPIAIEGGEFPVRENLETALRYLRLGNEPRTFWIDAICINQDDNHERSSQVQLMRFIYEKAERVTVWLGPESENSHEAIKFVEHLVVCGLTDTAVVNSLRNKEHGRCWEALASLLKREYWTRIWIVQEIVCAVKATIYVGENALDWGDLAQLGKIVQKEFNKAFPIPKVSDFKIQGFFDIAFMQILRSQKDEGKYSDLQSLISCIGFRNCTDPKDRVYGVLGISSLREDSVLRPNYSTSLEEVYTNAVRCIIRATGDLTVICDTYTPPGAINSFQSSWIPDWSKRPKEAGLHLGGVSYPGDAYQAARRTATDATFHNHGQILRATGIPAGRIEFLSDKCSKEYGNAMFGVDIKPLLLRWLKLALQSVPKNLGNADAETWRDKRVESFWRTLVCDRSYDLEGIDPLRYRHMFNVVCGFQSIPVEFEPNLSDAKQRSWKYIQAFVRQFAVKIQDKKFFTTGPVLMGLVNDKMEVGDLITVFLGCDIPLVLRFGKCGNWNLIGEAYVQGIMNGEVLDEVKRGALSTGTFNIE